MKKYIILIFTFLLCLSFCACSEESAENEPTTQAESTEIKRTIGPSEIFTEAEINEAMDAVEMYLGTDNKSVTEIIYDEAFSLAELETYNHHNGNENPLLLLITKSDYEEATYPTEFGEEYAPERKGISKIWVAEYASETWWAFDSFYHCSPYPFSINPHEVTEVVVGNGSNGEHKVCTKEQAAEIIAMLNEFHCRETNQIEATNGWTYGIRITEKNGDSYWLTIRDGATIEPDPYTAHTAMDPDYFSNFIETWY